MQRGKQNRKEGGGAGGKENVRLREHKKEGWGEMHERGK